MLGDEGIEYRPIIWSGGKPVYIASFARAIADILFTFPKDHPRVLELYGSRASLMTPEIEKSCFPIYYSCQIKKKHYISSYILFQHFIRSGKMYKLNIDETQLKPWQKERLDVIGKYFQNLEIITS